MAVGAAENATVMDTLFQDLKTGYDIKQRELDIRTKVGVELQIRHVELIELSSTIRIYGRIKWVSTIKLNYHKIYTKYKNFDN